MALYEGLKAASEKPAPAPARPALRPLPPPRSEPLERRWKELHLERPGTGSGAGFLDRLLGQGSQAKVSQALAPSRRSTREEAEAPPWRRARVEAVGSGQRALPAGKKGLGRAAIVVLALAWGLVRLHPAARLEGALNAFHRDAPPPPAAASSAWGQDLASLFRPSSDEERAQEEAKQAAQDKAKEAQEQLHLAALPVDPAGGAALALWQDAAGKWWQVNGKAELRPCGGPADKESLGLPELRGVCAQAAEHGQGKRLSLKLPEGLLRTLLPLEPSVASEVRALLLEDPSQPALLTHDGTRCLLDPSDWERRQRRLGLVLADLAAKKRRAALIDLRFEDTAVVRPAGRV
jgi:hypothetical protein